MNHWSIYCSYLSFILLPLGSPTRSLWEMVGGWGGGRGGGHNISEIFHLHK